MSRELRRYETEAPVPTSATAHETIRYLFDEAQRRAYHATKGLDDILVNTELGQGTWSIGSIVHHQLNLVRFITQTLEPGSLMDLPMPDEVGRPGAWRLEPLLAYREALAVRFREVIERTPVEALMEKRALPPESWAEWPVLMRVLRPLLDLGSHTGQINYARRLLGTPVEKH